MWYTGSFFTVVDCEIENEEKSTRNKTPYLPDHAMGQFDNGEKEKNESAEIFITKFSNRCFMEKVFQFKFKQLC